MPAAQAVQAVLPVPAAHVPATHVVQLEAPAALYEPAAQGVQIAAVCAPVAAEDVPAGHEVQLAAPASA